MSQTQPRSKKLHYFNSSHPRLLSFATVGFGVAFLSVLAYLSGGPVLAAAFAAGALIFVGARSVLSHIQPPGRSSEQPEDDARS
jgi:hypothetical protein